MEREELIQKYEARGRRTGGIFLLDPTSAIELIADAQAVGIKVLGLDGFLVRQQGIQPLQECELDVEQDPDPHEVASKYLREFADGGLMFEVALAE